MKHLPRFHIKRFLPAANELLQRVQNLHALSTDEQNTKRLFVFAVRALFDASRNYFSVAGRVELVNKRRIYTRLAGAL
jgi:hypothetical protein